MESEAFCINITVELCSNNQQEESSFFYLFVLDLVLAFRKAWKHDLTINGTTEVDLWNVTNPSHHYPINSPHRKQFLPRIRSNFLRLLILPLICFALFFVYSIHKISSGILPPPMCQVCMVVRVPTSHEGVGQDCQQ